VPPFLETFFEIKGSIYIDYDYNNVFNTEYLSAGSVWETPEYKQGYDLVDFISPYTQNGTLPTTINLADQLNSQDSNVLNFYNDVMNKAINDPHSQFDFWRNQSQSNFTQRIYEMVTNSITEQLRPTNQPVSLYYSVTTIITFFMLFRIYHFFRVIHSFSYWATPRADAICKIMNSKADVSFAIRAYLKQLPFIALTFGVCFTIVFFGFSVGLFEYYNSNLMHQMGATKDKNTNYAVVGVMEQFSNIYNSYWLILVTMTTSIVNINFSWIWRSLSYNIFW
jgi:hypothetical protein